MGKKGREMATDGWGRLTGGASCAARETGVERRALKAEAEWGAGLGHGAEGQASRCGAAAGELRWWATE
jgi:hypothetical protein